MVRSYVVTLTVLVLAGCSMTQEEMQSLGQSMQQTGRSFNAPQYNYNYTAPQVMPLTMPGSNQVRCINTGIYTNCRY